MFVNIGEYLFPEFKYRWFIEELKVNVSKELDFKMEVNNIKEQSNLMKNVKNFSVPKTFDHICGVLTNF
jgi:predicted unusual protein kinase regulating ubiquinone biosynthesis (AarF/ABC1/UbiB family)